VNRPSAGMLFLVGDEIIFFLDLELRFNLDNRGADTDSRASAKWLVIVQPENWTGIPTGVAS
jgi:hypothetical protein